MTDDLNQIKMLLAQVLSGQAAILTLLGSGQLASGHPEAISLAATQLDVADKVVQQIKNRNNP